MSNLTPTERRILEMEKREYTDQEIARDYRVSIETIKQIKATARAKRMAPNTGGEHWNR